MTSAKSRPWCSPLPAAFLAGVMVAGACFSGSATLLAQPPANTSKSADEAGTKKFRGRLPAYYKHVVSEKQRKEIYGIQKGYAEKIHALRTQIMELLRQRDGDVSAVLTDEQQVRVAKLVEDAKARRSRPKEDESDAPDGTAGQAEN